MIQIKPADPQPECCNQSCRQGRDCPARMNKEPMNNINKLEQEALQVYRATGLSPVELQKQREELVFALKHIQGLGRKSRSDKLDVSDMLADIAGAALEKAK